MLTDLTLTEAQARLRAGDLTAVELTQAYLDRIRTLDPQVRAFLVVTEELALAAAERADQRRQEGDDTPLLGIPFAIKDVLSTRGIPTTCGSRILEGFVPPYTATAVQKLFDAGAIMLGKTNLDEFAMGSSTENSGYFVTHNPWDLDRVPGGSSGGSAAVVASRMAPGALGTDTGGSVRQPAALCGVCALKPSYGRVSRYGLIAFASSLDQIGVFGRTVEDLAVLLGEIAGHDPRDSTSMDLPVPDYTAALTGDIHGLRVGVPKEYFIPGMQPEVEQAVRAAIQQMAALGADVREISLPHTEYALPVYYLIAPSEASANLARFDGVRYGPRHIQGAMWDTYKATRGQGFGPEVKRRIMLGTYALSAGYYDAYYLKAQKVRTLIKQDFDQAYRQVDVIVSPTAPTTAFRIGEKVDDPLQMYLSDVFTLSASLAGVAGAAVPCGFDRSNLPIGLQVIGPAFDEPTALRAAHAYQQATDWHTRKPPLQAGAGA
ncbi:MAG TPA: Asp-tRNA(Asn)/Glu-tRNA(Gln) amidotransferase subunit GatA [Aggregatilineaceae bacterium]|nr:Asp-tRNA(Asn)/Glu-tRNA(Gln) amidotransferase subunit GatA [Aggregatilineaceae bacterium]